MNFTETGTYIYNGETVEYHYSPTATYTEQVGFVRNVGDTVVNKDSGYIPLLKDVVFRLFLVQTFTDINMGQFIDDDNNNTVANRPINIDLFDEFDKTTDVSGFLTENISPDIIINLQVSVDDYIAHKTGISRDNISVAIVELIKQFTGKLNGINAETLVNAFFESEEHKENVAKITDKNHELQSKLNALTAKNVLADKVIPIIKGEQ